MGLGDVVKKALGGTADKLIDEERVIDEKALVAAAGDRLEAMLDRGLIVEATVGGTVIKARISLGMGAK